MSQINKNRLSAAAGAALLVMAACGRGPGPAPEAAPVVVAPVRGTEPVTNDADDPAIWIHPQSPELSLIIGTDKEAAPGGALVVFDLNGKTLQRIGPLNRPNNVDVRSRVATGHGEFIDVAVTTERFGRCLRVYRIDPATRRLNEISGTGGLPVFAGQEGEAGEPMGIALYHRPADGALFAITGRKTGPSGSYLWQYRLEFAADGAVKGTKVREFGNYSGRKEIEAIVADDELGFVYYADEGHGIHKYAANPDGPDSNTELAVFAQSGFQGDHEGLAVLPTSATTGYLIATDQIDGSSRYFLFPREGQPGQPHQHPVIAVFQGNADATDGIEATAAPLGPGFPHGLFVAMNSSGRNFLLYSWKDVASALRLPSASR
jgi:3-phytase